VCKVYSLIQNRLRALAHDYRGGGGLDDIGKNKTAASGYALINGATTGRWCTPSKPPTRKSLTVKVYASSGQRNIQPTPSSRKFMLNHIGS